MYFSQYIQQKLETEDLRRACNFYYPQDLKKPEKEIISSLKIGFSFLSLGCIFLLLGEFLFAMVLCGIAPVSYIVRFTQLSRKHKTEMQKIERYVNLIHGEIQLVSNTTGSIVDAIELISLGNYSHISEDLAKASYAINKGEVPEEIIRNLSFKPYPKPIQEMFSKLAKINHKDIQLGETSLPMQYTSFSEQLQVRLTVSIALSTFIPLIINCILLIQGWGTSVLIWGFYALLCAVVYLFDRMLLASS
ncbi:MAG: hypothetical protein ACXACA_06805, partial [Candidatus Ranarchaeia archaeon]